MSHALPTNIGAPATRALASAGIASLDDLVRRNESDVAGLHGMGPKALGILHRHVAEAGLNWAGHEGARAVDAYLALLPPAHREALSSVRDTLRRVLPHADECMKYGMPAIALDGKGVAGYAAFKEHWSYFPMSGSVLEVAGDAVARYERTATNGGLKLGFGERLPVALVRRLVKLRVAEISAVENGRRSEYYGDGRLKAVGPVRDGQLHGKWKWYRQDGTLLRTGQFAKGEQVGTWTTFDRAENPSKITKF
jgi:uncharacterized protein YdhG (YjbR/CyaY superfamily)